MLIQTEVGRAEVVAKQLAALPGVLSSEYVTGPYDVVVRIGADTIDRPAGQGRAERAAGRRHHPHADLPDRPGPTLELPVWHPRPTTRGRPPRALLIAAIAVAVAAVVAVLVIAALRQTPEQLQPVADRVGARAAGRQPRMPRR